MSSAKQVEVNNFVQRALQCRDSEAYTELVETLARLVRVVSDPGVQPGKSHVKHLVTLLHGLATVATGLNHLTHQSLLTVLYGINFWTASAVTLDAWSNLIMHKVAVRAAFVEPCVRYLVKSFVPPSSILGSKATDLGQRTFALPAGAEVVHARVVGVLTSILEQSPGTWHVIQNALASTMPHKLAPCTILCCYVQGAIRLVETPAGRALQDSLLAELVDKVVELDCEIRWQEIAPQLAAEQERGAQLEEEAVSEGEEEEDMFGMDVHVGQLQLSSCGDAGAQATASSCHEGWEGRPDAHLDAASAVSDTTQQSLDVAYKLDAFIGLLFSHLRHRAGTDKRALWGAMMNAFERSILLSQRVKFTPFLVFLTCNVCGNAEAHMFVERLIARVCRTGEQLVVRTTCAAYVASFVARYVRLPLTDVVSALSALVHFAVSYAERTRPLMRRVGSTPWAASMAEAGPWSLTRWKSAPGTALTAVADWQDHEVFYAVCQAVMYILCYHMRQLGHAAASGEGMEATASLQALVKDEVAPLMACSLQPLAVCLPTVSQEFVKQCAELELGDLQLCAAPGMARVNRRFEMFFPFDPYLLPTSAAQLQLPSSYRAWRHGHVVRACCPVAAVAGGAASDDDATRDTGDSDQEADSDGGGSDSESDVGESPRMSDMGASLPDSCAAQHGAPVTAAPTFNPFAVQAVASRASDSHAVTSTGCGGDAVGQAHGHHNASSTSDGFLCGHSYASSMQDALGHSPDGAVPMSLSDSAIEAGSLHRSAQRREPSGVTGPVVIHHGWPRQLAVSSGLPGPGGGSHCPGPQRAWL